MPRQKGSNVEEQQVSASPLVTKLWKLAKSKRYEELEAAWLAAIESEPIEPEGMLSVLEVLTRRGDTEPAESLLWYLLTAQVERMGDAKALDTARRGAALLPQSSTLREEAVSLYRKAHASFPAIETLTEMTLARGETPLCDAVAQMDQLLLLAPGAYVLHEDRPGRVKAVDPAAKVLLISFEDGDKGFEAAAVRALRLLGADDVRALAAFERDRLKALAEADPAELVQLVLKTFGREVTLRDLKGHLKDVIPSSAWTDWWTAAKPKVKRSPFLDVSEGTQPKFFLRYEAARYEDRVRAQFDSADSTEKKLSVVLDYLGEPGPDAPADPELLKRFVTDLEGRLGAAAADAPIALGLMAVLARIRKAVPDLPAAPAGAIETVLSFLKDPATLLRSIQDDRIARCILGFLRDLLPQMWPSVYGDIMPGASAEVCQGIAEALTGEGRHDVLGIAAGKTLARSDASPQALVWLWRATCAGEFPEALGQVDRVAVVLSLLRTVRTLKRGASAGGGAEDKDALHQVRSALSARNYAALRKLIEKTDPAQAKAIRDAVQFSLGLSEHAQTEILSILQEHHPERATETLPPWREEATYTTEAGLQKRRQEYEHLVNVRMAEIIKEIAKAISFGDISENAEYTAAVEQRDRLSQKAFSMQQELSKAKLIVPGMVRKDIVTVGSRVQARNLATNATETFNFLGPWDADPDKGVYSYLAPLSLAFMGKKRGETVLLRINAEERRWEVLDIGSAL